MGALREGLGVRNLEGAQEGAQGTGEGSERVGGFGRGRSGRWAGGASAVRERSVPRKGVEWSSCRAGEALGKGTLWGTRGFSVLNGRREAEKTKRGAKRKQMESK